MKTVFHSSILLFFLAASALAQSDTCRVKMLLRDYHGNIAPYVIISIKRLVKDGHNITLPPTTNMPASDANGVVQFRTLRASTIWIYASVAGLDSDKVYGKALSIPDADTAWLTTNATTTVPPLHMLAMQNLRVRKATDSALITTLVFGNGTLSLSPPYATFTAEVGTGDTTGLWLAVTVLSGQTSELEANKANRIYVNSQDSLILLRKFFLSIAGACVSIDSVNPPYNSWHPLVTFDTACIGTKILSMLSPTKDTASLANLRAVQALALATVARDTASKARLEIAAHVARTDNPHSVTAAQIGALTSETDPVWLSEKSGYATTTLTNNQYAALRDTSRNWRTFVTLTGSCLSIDSSTAGKVVLSFSFACVSDSLAKWYPLLGQGALGYVWKRLAGGISGWAPDSAGGAGGGLSLGDVSATLDSGMYRKGAIDALLTAKENKADSNVIATGHVTLSKLRAEIADTSKKAPYGLNAPGSLGQVWKTLPGGAQGWANDSAGAIAGGSGSYPDSVWFNGEKREAFKIIPRSPLQFVDSTGNAFTIGFADDSVRLSPAQQALVVTTHTNQIAGLQNADSAHTSFVSLFNSVAGKQGADSAHTLFVTLFNSLAGKQGADSAHTQFLATVQKADSNGIATNYITKTQLRTSVNDTTKLFPYGLRTPGVLGQVWKMLPEGGQGWGNDSAGAVAGGSGSYPDSVNFNGAKREAFKITPRAPFQFVDSTGNDFTIGFPDDSVRLTPTQRDISLGAKDSTTVNSFKSNAFTLQGSGGVKVATASGTTTFSLGADDSVRLTPAQRNISQGAKDSTTVNSFKGNAFTLQGSAGVKVATASGTTTFSLGADDSVRMTPTQRNVSQGAKDSTTVNSFKGNAFTLQGSAGVKVSTASGTTTFSLGADDSVRLTPAQRNVSQGAKDSTTINGTKGNSFTIRQDTLTKAFGYYAATAADSNIFWECREFGITVIEVRAIRKGGTSATINVSKNRGGAVSFLLASDYTTTTSMASAGTPVNTGLTQGDILMAKIVSIAGTVTELYFQITYVKTRVL